VVFRPLPIEQITLPLKGYQGPASCAWADSESPESNAELFQPRLREVEDHRTG